ncbi:hypothetical protein [Neorhizobium alkalisoli]|uniref:Uncharacterized protein n=1 Tax=Neorhizobium alkalisoli TaxID=528178 RepID=A0A561R433_9HYPH|nr:hypothetical protein [Neorhizobium alkalisoli]TWF57365.1 hypothetical protein FHW37_1021009 [Neorhizobium alkalisoli]
MADEEEKARVEKMTDRRMDAAHKAFDGHRKTISDSFALVGSFATTAMRAPAIAAGAGIAALLGFFSANRGALAGTEGIAFFNHALSYFCGSIALSVICSGIAYLSQLLVTNSLQSYTFNYDSPFVLETRRRKLLNGFGAVFQISAILLGLASIGLLVCGGWFFMMLTDFLATKTPLPSLP